MKGAQLAVCVSYSFVREIQKVRPCLKEASLGGGGKPLVGFQVLAGRVLGRSEGPKDMLALLPPRCLPGYLPRYNAHVRKLESNVVAKNDKGTA